MNYETLYNNIQSYSENYEPLFIASIPVFIEEAEQRIYNSVNLPSLRKNVTTTLTAGNPYLSLPSDYLATYSLAVIDTFGVYSYLLNKDVSFIRESYPGNPALTQNQGAPKYYALFGSQYADINELSVIMAPCPDLPYSAEMYYFYYPPTIVQGQVSFIDNLTGGSLYTNGVYQNVPLTGGSGANATADIIVVGGVVTSCTLKFGGNFYVINDLLSCASLGSTGSGFSVKVTQVSNATGQNWLGDNYDPPCTLR